MNQLYAFTFKENGEIVDADSVRKYWPNYGRGQYAVSKKMYLKEHLAKSGFARLPESLKPLVTISLFVNGGSIVDCDSLMKEQKERKEKKERDRIIFLEKYRIEQAKKEIEKAQKVLDGYKNKQ